MPVASSCTFATGPLAGGGESVQLSSGSLSTVAWTRARCPAAVFGTKNEWPCIRMCAWPEASAISIQQPFSWQTDVTLPLVVTVLLA